MNYTERRNRMRKILSGSECLSPASVFDALSARVAESVGYELGMLAGSVASNTTLAAPDLIVLTMTEFADQIRRIQRASTLTLLVDADHGYGNALNVMRTVEECEHAGVSAMSIEDTVLPTRFGGSGEELISVEEGAIKRAKAYAAAGVDAIFLVGVEKLEHVKAVHDAAKLPIIMGSAPASIRREEFAAAGARVLLQGHQPVAAAVKALRDVYDHLHKGGSPKDLASKIASNEEMNALTRGDEYKGWQRDYLR
jgi:carboxyvinyl-carboxyphosphonate phosphorylmutase